MAPTSTPSADHSASATGSSPVRRWGARLFTPRPTSGAPVATERGPSAPSSDVSRPERSAAREGLVYTVYAATCTLWVALIFYSAMRQQVLMLYASHAGSPLYDELLRLGPWSAPLDDVFIHFDFARATARGYPFQWSEGNGYSTGGTSLVYPFILSLGYWIGFRHLWLVVWAAVIACVSVLGFLLAARRMYQDLPLLTSYLAPPALLGVGALSWSLFSGMEVALFLGLWGGALVAWDDVLTRAKAGADPRPVAAVLGLWGALLVATRPESATTVAVFALGTLGTGLRRGGVKRSLAVVALAALPAVALVVGQAVINRWLTGDATAAGAMAKLELHDPYRTPARILSDWQFYVQYQVMRVTEHHLADDFRHGWYIWVLALVPLVPRATRRFALLLWVSAVAWVLVVGLNGQVRWQNERYAMPALAWFLQLAALGVGALVGLPRRGGWRGFLSQWVAVSAVALTLVTFARHQRVRFGEQVWFFGRASRNILEQHVTTGLVLRYAMNPPPHRVALGDAGAIPYVADLPALDLIGLGGYENLPFARAKRHGLGCVLELIERIPPTERPDVMALYPSWWDELPPWFGDHIVDVSVRGNVVCGGTNKTLYQADWAPFEGTRVPVGLRPGEEIVDSLDVADLLEEDAHRYTLSERHTGHVVMKILPNPARPDADLWDAGRTLPAHVLESFVLRGLTPGKAARLILRVAEPRQFALELHVQQQALAAKRVDAADAWQHVAVEVPAGLVAAEITVTLRGTLERDSYHLWAVQAR